MADAEVMGISRVPGGPLGGTGSAGAGLAAATGIGLGCVAGTIGRPHPSQPGVRIGLGARRQIATFGQLRRD